MTILIVLLLLGAALIGFLLLIGTVDDPCESCYLRPMCERDQKAHCAWKEKK